MLPSQEYNFFPCRNAEGSLCGCYTVLKKSKVDEPPNCKAHGDNADEGAGVAVQALRDAGLDWTIVTQCPIHSDPAKHVSRALPSMNRTRKGSKCRGGVYTSRTLKVDFMLCSNVGCRPVFAVVEVQGRNHSDSRVAYRDEVKFTAVDLMGLAWFEMDVAQQYRPRDTRSRTRRCTAVGPYVSHFDSVAHEVVNFLTSK